MSRITVLSICIALCAQLARGDDLPTYHHVVDGQGNAAGATASADGLPPYTIPVDALHAVAHVDKPGPIKAAPWLHEGLRLSYVGKHAIIQGSQFKIVPNGGGQFVLSDGTRIDIWRSESAGAVIGVDQDTIAAIDGDKVVVVTRGYLYDPLQLRNPPRPNGMRGGMLTLGEGKFGDRIVDPAILRPYLTTPAQGVTVVHLNYAAQNQTFDAISVLYETARSSTVNVYDLKSGLQLRSMSISRDADPAIIVAGDVPRGNTHVDIIDLIAARDVSVPGADQGVPEALARAQTIHAVSSALPLGNPNLQPARARADCNVAAHGANWVQFSSPDPKIPGKTNKDTNGSAQFLGFWMAPAALAKMQKGQMLDEDPVVQSRTFVAFVDERSVVIADRTSDVEFAVQYDKRTGLQTMNRRLGGSPRTENRYEVTGIE